MFYKTIIQGRLEFGNPKSYEKVTKMFQQRVETYYKTDVIFKFEEIFLESDWSVEIPRYVNQVTDKAFRTTTSLLKYLAQFAVTGSIRAWLINEGEILQFETIEPDSDKGAILSYVKGKNLVKVIGKESEAIEALSQAIEKYDRHAQAYERRAKVNFFLKNFHDAIRDYNKCIALDPTIPTAYYGKAKILIIKEEYEEAIKNLEEAIKISIALQPLYWKSRRLKAECHIKLKQWSKAAFDLKLFTNRKFEEDNPNKDWLRWAQYNYAVTLMELNEIDDAIKILDKALSCPNVGQMVSDEDILVQRGLAKHKAGKSGFLKDLKDAAELGDTRASNLIKSISKRK